MASSKILFKFLDNCRRRGLSGHTSRAYESDLRLFSGWLDSLPNSNGVDRGVLVAWVDHLRAEGLSAATIKRRLASLRSAYCWLEEEGLIEANPFTGFRLRIPLPGVLPRDLSRKELAVLFEKAAQEAGRGADISAYTRWLAMELMFATGIGSVRYSV